jgi:hypothetical protein
MSAPATMMRLTIIWLGPQRPSSSAVVAERSGFEAQLAAAVAEAAASAMREG